MTFESGTRLGAYEIVSLVGAGGMGEVYRARDPKLGREVALKVLPETVTRDPDRLARFEREAQLLAALNHPGIATLHGLEESDGAPFLVMELVEGETLADRLARGPLRAAEALPLFVQIAEALEAAHEKGIVHRDLKPANVKITPGDRAKVLDFGLAKAYAAESAAPDSSQSPTALRDTAAGVIVGTAAYMSPEQARGKPVDPRTDTWAFGCCLYEALTGRRTFEGADMSDTLAAVLRDAPDWSALPADTPAPVLRLLRRCLERRPERRLAHVADARLELEDALSGTSEVRESGVSGGGSGRRALAAVGIAGVLLGTFLGSLLRRGDDSAPRQVTRSILPMAPGERLGPRLAVSPDGRSIVYQVERDGRTSLRRRRLDELKAIAIDGTDGADEPFFSPDGVWIGFWAHGVLKRVSASGGPAVDIGVTPRPRGATWGPDDTILFGTISPDGAVYRIAAGGGEAERVVQPGLTGNGERTILWPRRLPDGRGLLLTLSRAPGIESKRIAVLPPEGPPYRELTPGSGAVYMPSGHLVFARETAIWAAPFDLERLELTGAPVPVIPAVGVDPATGTSTPRFDVSPEGLLVYAVTADSARDLYRPVWVTRDGEEEPLDTDPGQYRVVRISPDGRYAALATVEGGGDIWIWHFDRRIRERLTWFDGQDARPVWTPDGRRVVHSSVRDGPPSIYSIAVDGTEEARPELKPDASARVRPGTWPDSLSPDGRWLVAQRSVSGADARLVVLPWGENRSREPERVIEGPYGVFQGSVSPDGRFIAYVAPAVSGGEPEVQVRTFPDVDRNRWPVSSGGGYAPAWGPDGRELFFVSESTLTRVAVNTEDAFEVGAPEPLFTGSYYFEPLGGARTYDVSPDGRRFLMLRREGQAETGEVDRIVLVQNWLDELEELVPGG